MNQSSGIGGNGLVLGVPSILLGVKKIRGTSSGNWGLQVCFKG